jgi:hypothetical protein
MQDRASGAAGRLYGLQTGALIARLVGARQVSTNSNEVVWNDRCAVIKACAPNNNFFGVTAKMLNRLQDIYGAFELDNGDIELWWISPERFSAGERPSPSARNRGADTRLIRKRFVKEVGKHVRTFKHVELDAAR